MPLLFPLTAGGLICSALAHSRLQHMLDTGRNQRAMGPAAVLSVVFLSRVVAREDQGQKNSEVNVQVGAKQFP